MFDTGGAAVGAVLVRCTTKAARVLVQANFDLVVEMPDLPSVRMQRMSEGTGISLAGDFVREVTPPVLEDLQFLSERRLPVRAKALVHHDHTIEPGESLETGELSDSGRPIVWGVGGDQIPADTMAMADEARQFGTMFINRAFQLLVWRYYRKGSVNPPRPSAECSVDGGATWFALPQTIRGVMTVENGITPNATGSELSRLARKWAEPPAGYALLWEARGLSSTNARLALTITALEVGTKEFIGRCVPGADWLLENLQSPPVFKLLRDYLPLLTPIVPGFDSYLPPSAGVLTAINKGVQARNALLHRGESFTAKEMADLDAAVHTVLTMLDRYAGEKWSFPGDD